MATTTNITEITVYWDTQDPQREGWAMRWWRGDHEESEAIDGIDDNDLDGAIREACRYLEVDLQPHDFACEPRVDGGYAVWSAK